MSAFLAPPPPADLRPGVAPTFSVVIPAYQAARTIGTAIESVRAQTFAPVEIIVCDDGSTDDLPAVLASHRDIVTLLRQENRGVGAARNVLVRAATAEFVAPLDADDVFAPTRLERLAELAVARPDLDILATDAFLVSDGRRVATFLESTPFAVDRQREAILDRCFLHSPAIRRRRLVAEGGYDERLRTGEDWDAYIRLIYAGAAAGLVDEPLFEYRLRGEGLTANRGETLVDRVLVLERVSSRQDLSDDERRALKVALSRHRGRALQQVARDAVFAHDRTARAQLLSVARSRDVPPRARGGAALAAVAPSLARRLVKATLSESSGRPVL